MPATLTHYAKCVAHSTHCHLVPSEHNDYVPHVLKHRVLLGYNLILILVKALILSGYALLPAAAVYSSSVSADNIIRLTNAARDAIGLIELREDPKLAAAAADKAEDMAVQGYFSHTSPSGVTPWDWIKGAGYAYRYAGENLAVHYFTSEDALGGWMASPTHRKNITDERYSEIGVGVANGKYEGYDTTFVVQMFGTPQETAPAAVSEPVPAPTVAEPPSIQEPLPAEPTIELVPEDPPVVLAAKVVPQEAEGSFRVEIESPEAENISLILGQSSTELTADAETGIWKGEITAEPDSLDVDGEVVVAHVTTESGPVTEVLAVVAPNAGTQEMFIQQGSRKPLRLFGFIAIDNLEDAAFRFYVMVSILLGALLLVSVVVKFEIQKHSVTAHALFVIGLSLTLAFI